MALFDFETVSEIYAKAVQLNLADRRDALLSGVDLAYRSTLEVSARPSDQMLLDLRAMNRSDSAVGSANQEIPLRLWLSNAALLSAAQPELKAWFDSVRDRTTAQPAPLPAETQRNAETALEYMQAIARDNPQLRAALIAARGDLEELVNTVILVVVYKRLHDLLHEIQIFKLPMIVAMLRRGLASNEDWMMFSQQVAELEFKHERATDELAKLTEESPERINQESWLSDFGEVIVSLNGVIEAKSTDRASDAIFDLRRLVGKKMSDLNQLLYYSAGRLRINVLTEHLRAFAGSLAIDDVRAIELRDAATGLLKLKAEIENLLRDHNTWQQVDDDLFAAEGALVFSDQGDMMLRSFSVLWPRVVGRLTKVAGAGTDGWYLSTQGHATAFGASCPMPATPPIAPSAMDDFGQFLKVTRNRFFDVDKELKTRCDRLAKVADPIERLAQVQ